MFNYQLISALADLYENIHTASAKAVANQPLKKPSSSAKASSSSSSSGTSGQAAAPNQSGPGGTHAAAGATSSQQQQHQHPVATGTPGGGGPEKKDWQRKMSELFARCCGGGKKGRRRNGTERSAGSGSGESDQNLVGVRQRLLRANDRELPNIISKNLFEQFQRLANTYFLFLLCLQMIPWVSSVVWYSTAVPLFFVLAMSAMKDAYDDIQRHRSDRQVNNRISYVVRDGRLVEEKWMNVKVGDIVRMENEHFIAADLLLLSTSEPHGLCYIETAELDGETNLKTRSAPPETADMGDIVKQISAFNGHITCEAPNNRLDVFEGRLEFDSKMVPLNNTMMLLRGCRLRNTRWCYGVVVFAGKETKLMMNSGQTKLKRTSLDRFLNVLIMGIVLFLIAMCLICTILCGVWEWSTGRHFTEYLDWDRTIIPKPDERSGKQIALIALLMFFSYIILLNTVVPISLYVSVEVLRFAHSMFINFDREMYYEKNDIAAQARTTTLNEELGQVQYIFSDKTGTLTQNIMTFNKCSINGRSYGDLINDRGEYVEITDSTRPLNFAWNRWHEPSFKFYDRTLLEDTRKGMTEVTEFWKLLALCHTVMPERKAGNILEYQAQSPDEAALTSAARNFGYIFKSRTPQSITIEVDKRDEIYQVLHILDFDNTRKRMSVIVKDKHGVLKLYCKGADTTILSNLKKNTSELLRSATTQHLDKFAADGLRTLCCAVKDLEVEYCNEWLSRVKIASGSIVDRQKKLDKLYEEMEKDMTLIGATAIEDKLQDGVPETIFKLAHANIKIWVLTGDKMETAINIGYSCRLLTEEMAEVFVVNGKEEKEVEVQLKSIKRRLDQVLSQQLGGAEELVATSKFYNLDVDRYISDIITMLDDKEEKADGDGETYEMQYRGFGRRVSHVAFSRDPPRLYEDRSTTNPVSSSNGGAAQNGSPHFTENAAQTPNVDWPDDEERTGGYGLVITGESLEHALKPQYERTLLDIGCMCTAVICCRVTPLQKAKVVNLVKKNKKSVTLAIGDGANDVSMIKTAHIGIGISGQEGMQAVLASDYSIGQFKYLQRLLLVHGRWSYYRMAKFLRYFFYKNFSFTLTNFWYSFFCGYSAQSIYDQLLITLYNLCFTALPVLAMGILDQDVNDKYSLRYAKLYIPGQYNLFFNMRTFVYSVLHGIISSIVLFFVPYGTFYMGTDHSGRDMNDYPLLAFTIFTALIIVVTMQIMLDTAYWTVINHITIWGSLLFYFALVIIYYEALPIRMFAGTASSYNYGIAFRAFASPHFWFSIVMVVAILILPVIINRFFWFHTHPTYADRLRVKKRIDEELCHEPVEVPLQPIPRTAATRRSRRNSLRSGYAFSHSQGFGDLIQKGKLFKNIENLRSVPSSSRQPSTSRQSPLSPVQETPPGLIGAAAAVPELQHQLPSSSNSIQSRPSTSDSYNHRILVNPDNAPLPNNWSLSEDPRTMPSIRDLDAPTQPGSRPMTGVSRPNTAGGYGFPPTTPGSSFLSRPSTAQTQTQTGLRNRNGGETEGIRGSLDSIDRIVEKF
ncbi:hypothetical protein L596_005622 [Steinernema carpocapsae]|uniref:Phospholipid-transporting ATPase n=1 Tax=Steinernema carpocapsae TaxID=34508 RepID=A0A4U8V119_STECR|nr:hypothetical protein L596_005622 [Steinernema carpocapsae]